MPVAERTVPITTVVWMEPSEGLLHGAVLHEALHATGVYEAMHPYPNSVHYAPLVSSIGLLTKYSDARSGISSILDVGCGTGAGVKALWSLGYTVSGVDISSSAIHQANQRYTDPARSSYPQCILHRCFVLGDASHIPFPSLSTDAILAAGLMEHVEPRHVKQVISEMARVARKYLFLMIASQPSMSIMNQLRAVPERGNRSGSELIIRDYSARAAPDGSQPSTASLLGCEF